MAEEIHHTQESLMSSEPQLCIICQEDNKKNLMTVSKDGLQSADSIKQLRMKLHHDNFRDATNRLTEILQGDLPQQFLWHKDCRAKYMNKHEIERKLKAELKKDTKPSSSASTPTLQNVTLWSKIPPIDWKQCIFCQQDQKEKLHLIQEMKFSSRILQAAKCDSFLRVRLACVNDLIAAEGSYHMTCNTRFDRRTKRMELLPRTDMPL